MAGDCIMNTTQIGAIIKYVDAKIEYELSSFGMDDEMECYTRYNEHGRKEQKAMEAAKEALMKCADSPG